MKLLKYIPLVLLLPAFSSCLKDNEVDDQKYGMKGVGDTDMVYFETDEAAAGFYPGNKDTTVNIFAVHLDSKDGVAKEDVIIKLRRRDDLINDLPASWGVEIPPADKFKLGNLEVKIPKGSNEGLFTITGNPSAIGTHLYALAFELESTNNSYTEVSAKYDTVYTFFEIRNKYDGVYEVTGSMTDHVNDLIIGLYPYTVELRTSADNAVALYDPVAHRFATPITSDGAKSVYGNFAPQFIFDAADKITDVDNINGQGTSSRWAKMVPDANNAFNNGTINVKFTMNQPNAATVRTEFVWRLRRTGPRR